MENTLLRYYDKVNYMPTCRTLGKPYLDCRRLQRLPLDMPD